MDKKDLQKLFEEMTEQEKISQLLQMDGTVFKNKSIITGPESKIKLTEENINNIGSIYNVFNFEEIKNIQEQHLKNSKIPILFCSDIIHGFQTVLPIPLAYSSSWNTELIAKGMSMVAKESAATGAHVVFSPVLDVSRDPRWGRVMETRGEDAYLTSEFAKAEIEALQGDFSNENVGACIKHFAGYGAPTGGREYNTVDVTERTFREVYLPGYKAAIDAGSVMVMTSFNTIDGIPASANEWLLKDVLRNEWGFDGVVVSDYAAISELIYHGIAENELEAAKLAITASVDLDMKTDIYVNNLAEAIKKDPIYSEYVDKAVFRILNLKNFLGLFEDPYRGITADSASKVIATNENKKIAKKVADESIVLLKNKNGTLPIKMNKKIGLIGPYADEKVLNGMWAMMANSSQNESLKSIFESNYDGTIITEKGCNLTENNEFMGEFVHLFGQNTDTLMTDEQTDKAVENIKNENVDVLIVPIGEHFLQSGEAASRTQIRLENQQISLLKKLSSLGKPIVTVVFSGRPLIMNEVAAYSDAILQAWFPGSEGVKSIYDIIIGAVNPSAKLTMSFPQNEGQIPVFYNEFKTGRPLENSNHSDKFVSKYIDCSNKAFYSFGYGLSYTKFEYSNLQLSDKVITPGKTLNISIDVKNIGAVKGKEVVQLYIQDVIGSIVRPIKELKGFKKIELEPNEQKRVLFEINDKDLTFYNKENCWKVENGDFKVFVGTNSEETLSGEFMFRDC